MKNIKHYINFNESVKNLFEKDIYLKLKYMGQVWNILQEAYSEQGGVKGNGFNTPEDMLNIPFWKIDIIDNNVVAVFMYKFIKVNNVLVRKLIALGISRDNLELSRTKLRNIIKKEFKRSIFETSLQFENYILKNFPDEYDRYIFRVSDVRKILHDKDIIAIDEYRYSRIIGNSYHEKVMMGTISEKY